ELGYLRVPIPYGMIKAMLIVVERSVDVTLAIALDSQILVAIGAAWRLQAVEHQRAVLEKHLEREEVPPLCHRGVQRSTNARRAAAKIREDIVFDTFDFPVQVRYHGLHFVKTAAEIQEEIQHVDPLVQHDAA